MLQIISTYIGIVIMMIGVISFGYIVLDEKEKVSKIALKKGLLTSRQNMLENIFKPEKITTRNKLAINNNLLQSSKYSSKSVDIIKLMNKKMNFMKNSINYIFRFICIYRIKTKTI